MRQNQAVRGEVAFPGPRTAVALSTVLIPVTNAWAVPSDYCSDEYDRPSVQLLSGQFGLPLWLALESGASSGRPGAVGLCYSTGAPGQAKTLGGFTRVTVPGQSGGLIVVGNEADSNSAAGATVLLLSRPTWTVTPGGTSGGQAATVTIPFAICSGPCYTEPGGGLATTGLVVGQLSQVPAGPGGLSATYQVDQLCLTVNGIQLIRCSDGLKNTGVTTTGASPMNAGTGLGPCLAGICIPGQVNYVGTSGNQLATVSLLGVPITVSGVRACAYQKDPATQCP